MQGRITRGTTLQGRAVGEGEIVECSEDEYRKLAAYGDIEPVTPEVIAEPVHPEPEPAPKPEKPAKKKRK